MALPTRLDHSIVVYRRILKLSDCFRDVSRGQFETLPRKLRTVHLEADLYYVFVECSVFQNAVKFEAGIGWRSVVGPLAQSEQVFQVFGLGNEEFAGEFARIEFLAFLFGGAVEENTLTAVVAVFLGLFLRGESFAALLAVVHLGRNVLLVEMSFADTL